MLSVKLKSWSFHVLIDRGRQTKHIKKVMRLQSCCFAVKTYRFCFCLFVCLFDVPLALTVVVFYGSGETPCFI